MFFYNLSSRKGMSLFALSLKLGGKSLLPREQENDVVRLLVYDLVSILSPSKDICSGEASP